MKELKEFIDSHRNEIDVLEPLDGHFIRFQQKLNKSIPHSFMWKIKVAAVLLIAAVISANIMIFHLKDDDTLTTDLRETAYFYNLRCEKLLIDLKSNEFMNISEKQNLLKDIRNFDKEYDTLLKDLKNFPRDERLVNAFIDYHRSKTEFLEGILNQINTSNLTII